MRLTSAFSAALVLYASYPAFAADKPSSPSQAPPVTFRTASAGDYAVRTDDSAPILNKDPKKATDVSFALSANPDLVGTPVAPAPVRPALVRPEIKPERK